MEVKVINFGMKQKDTVYFCKFCRKHIISRKHHAYLESQCIRGGKRIFQNIEFEELL